MLDLDLDLVRRALAERPDSGFVTVTRPDGSSTMISRSIAEWLVSTAPAPSDVDVKVILHGATRARLVERRSAWGEPSNAHDDGVVHADVAEPAALEELRDALRLQDTGQHLLMTASYALEISGPEGLRATLGVVLQLSRLRWQGRWQTDARLTDRWALARWVAQHGSGLPLRRAQEHAAREELEARDEARARAAWMAAMPTALRPVWPRLIHDDMRLAMVPHDIDVSDALSALHSAANDEEATIRELLAWASLRPDSGPGWCIDELVALAVVRSFATDDALISCLAANPPPEVIAGAKRFLDWHRGFGGATTSSTRARRRHKASHSELRRRLVEVCPPLDAPP